jgi:hypothetical protein
MNAFAHPLPLVLAVLVLAGCGGGDPAEPSAALRAEPAALRAGTDAQSTATRREAGAPAVLAGAATTQAAIDEAIRSNAAASPSSR